MKKLITFLAIGIAISSFAHPKHHSSDLNLKLYDNGMFTVMLDNKYMNVPSTNFFFNNLKPGSHRLKVIKHYPACGFYVTPKIIFNGFIRIPAKSNVFAMINLYDQYEVYSMATEEPVPDGADDDSYYYENTHCENPWPAPPACMNHGYFQQLKYSISNTAFDSDKLKIAKQGIAANGTSAQQVLELMELLTFESNKVKLAKFAYQYTFDKQNYFVVNNGFTYSSSIQELNKFVSLY